MISYKLKQEIKQYIDNLNLYWMLNNENIKNSSKTIFYLMKQIHLNKENKKMLGLIKNCISRMTEFYVIKNNALSFNNDIKSIEQNKNQAGMKYNYAIFSNNNDDKYMLLGFQTSKILNPSLLQQNISDLEETYFKKFKNATKLSSSFLKDYFLFIKTNNIKNSLESIELFFEQYIKKQIRKFYAQLFLHSNKLNIYH